MLENTRTCRGVRQSVAMLVDRMYVVRSYLVLRIFLELDILVFLYKKMSAR